MRVLHINCNYMTTVLHQTMVEHLDETGVESHIFAPVYDPSLAVITPRSNVTVSACFKKWDRLCFDYKQHKIFSALKQQVDTATFDCIHAYTLFTDGNCAMRLSKEFGIPYVVAVRSTDVNAFFKYRPWLRSRGVQIMEQASAVFFLSERYLEQTLTQYVPKKKQDSIRRKCLVVPNGIDDFWLDHVPVCHAADYAAKLNSQKLDLIVAGRINRNKNQTTVMKAAELLTAQGWDVRLTVVGKVEDTTVVSQLSSSPLVTVLPAQSKETLITHYRNSDIFVMPSYEETFGLVYAEAMSQGLPVVYTRGQGFDGQFPEGVVGFAVDPDSPDEIAKKIVSVWRSYNRISSVCPELAQQFRWNRIVKTYSELYRKIVG